MAEHHVPTDASTQRIGQIEQLVSQWKRSLAESGHDEPTMNHHKLLMLVAEELVARRGRESRGEAFGG